MKATITGGNLKGDLRPIPNCYIEIPKPRSRTIVGRNTGGPFHKITFKILPEITDSKSSSYADAPVIGRSFPIKTYSHGENRTIGMKLHFVILKFDDVRANLQDLRAIQSAAYPRDDANGPYIPPPICRIKCGLLLAGESNGNNGHVCAVLKQYSVTYPTDVAWEDIGLGTLLPYKYMVDTSWDVVFPNERLPGQEFIFNDVMRAT